jgi:uncharacterized protein YmfQ (DUF2313 family)
MKTIIGLAIGIVLTAAVLIPMSNARTHAELEVQRTQIALETAQAEIEALKTAQMPASSTETTETHEITEVSVAPQETAETVETTEIAGTTIEETATPEPEKVEVKAEPTPTPPPQVQTAVYPKEFYIDGQKYAYLTAYAEEMGYKILLADESEPNVISGDAYDWLSDPLKDVKGKFQ